MSVITDRAGAKLLELLPPDEGCDKKTYRQHVMSWLAGKTVSLQDIQDMCVYYSCDCADLVDKVVRDQFGKG